MGFGFFLLFKFLCLEISFVELFYFTGIPYTLSRSGRPAIFTRDPDANALEFVQIDE